MLLRLCKDVDVIILPQENRGHRLPQNPRGLAQGNLVTDQAYEIRENPIPLSFDEM
jgi:hypothetical protein